MRASLLLLGVLLGCAPDEKRPAHYVLPDEDADDPITDTDVPDTDVPGLPDVPPSEAYTLATDQQLLRRASLDLRGVLPTDEEVAALRDDPAALSGLLDAYVDDPRLEEQLVQIFADQWFTRLDRFEVLYTDYFLEDDEEHLFERSVGEEPLRLMARVAVEDRPWTDIVTTGTTMANSLLGEIWPVDYPDDAEGWQEVSYTDGRPPAGVLATNGFHWRYVTNLSNRNRSRVVALSRLLICEDILSRPVSFSGADGLSVEGTGDAMTTNPYCVSCHASLEPLATLFFGFFSPAQYTRIEYERYHPEREMIYRDWLNAEPAWFGKPLTGLVDLGPHIAEDPRFARCAVERMAQGFWQRPVETWDFGTIESLRQAFDAGDLRAKVLIRAILDTDVYRAIALNEDLAPEVLGEVEVTTRMMGPALFGSAVEESFGFSWTYGGFDQLACDGNQDGDRVGYRTLMGGVNGDTLTRKPSMPGLTWAMTVKRVAEAAGAHAATADLAGDGPGLLTMVDALTQPGDEAFVAQLEQLHLRLFGVEADSDWLATITELWADVEAEEDATTAWSIVLSVIIRDPRFLTY